ncbi:MAG TPA: hypothetical protein VJ385_03950 [Fibrobacteria bacterium]|nr:hypothetical protein [Fibrobacteria bacterium]
MKIWSIFLLVMSFGTVAQLHAEDEKVKDKSFINKGNEITKLGTSTNGTSKYVVLGFKNKLDSKNSKGKSTDEKSNYGDSSSTYCYKKESDLGDTERQLLVEWFKNNGPLNLVYTCGDPMEEEKRKTFAGFAETNCQCLEFIFKPLPSRGLFR